MSSKTPTKDIQRTPFKHEIFPIFLFWGQFWIRNTGYDTLLFRAISYLFFYNKGMVLLIADISVGAGWDWCCTAGESPNGGNRPLPEPTPQSQVSDFCSHRFKLTSLCKVLFDEPLAGSVHDPGCMDPHWFGPPGSESAFAIRNRIQ
jgi:hypothetical protein